jgi:beta-lactamase class A
MPHSITRRTALAGSLLAVPGFAALATAAQGATTPEATDRFKDLERRHGGRLGVAILDLATGDRMAHRANERFPICSTFKFLAAAFVLARVDRGEERLDRRITFTTADLVTRAGRVAWSPVTETRVGGDGMTIAQLCEAAVALSDNSAANLLLASFGGPAALTTYLQSVGDRVTRLDRIEPDLNEATPGDPRDTTHAGGHAGDDAQARPRGWAVRFLPRASGGLARRHQDRGQNACGPDIPRGGGWATRPGPA